MDEFKTLKLSKPLKVFSSKGDREITGLAYDFEGLTARDKLNAGKKMKMDGIPPTSEHIDSDYHLYLFAEAASKADPSLDTNDILRMSAKDATLAGFIARSFFYLGSGE